MPNFISEAQIEDALLHRLHQHDYEILVCHAKPDELNDGTRRNDKREVFLIGRLKEAALRLNKKIPHAVIEDELERFIDRRQAMSLIAANREIYRVVRGGIEVDFDDERGEKQHETLRVIDFGDLKQNRYLAVSQMWLKGDFGYRRPDVLLYINGIPLVFIELKNSNIKLKTAYEDNIVNYRAEIPQVFLANALCVLSNGIETKVGAFSADFDYFYQWLRVEQEKEKIDRAEIREKGISLERLIEGLFPPQRLLDYVENFILYYKADQKIVAQNHQFIGVNNAYNMFLNRKEKEGKLGVFWHTQGSGKSFSMIFYVRKILRKLSANFTFVVVTDRDDLDKQIYQNFLDTGTVQQSDAARPKDSEEMRKYLGQNKRIVFTLIHKFRWDKGKQYPLLSSRDDIVVIVDEAHRTQYKALAENMRVGLPNAQYLAFTGTPLLGRDRKTNAWFGDYVSEYNFQQSMDDGSTVPLFYQKRVPQVLVQNEDLSDEFYEILEDENLDEIQQAKLEKKYAAEMEVIKRDDRLEKIAQDIVHHFPFRGYLGKGMVVSLDKFTAVKMYDKVQRYWKESIKKMVQDISKTTSAIKKQELKNVLEYMRDLEMAVIISEENGEEEKFSKQGLNIQPHRERMNRLDENGHDVEFNFKDPNHPLQLVFVCAMWLTGFDAPTVSTMYLDRPMKDHTLMQTIARANRVTSHRINGTEKKNGEIVDYYNVFRNMRKALLDYAQGQEGSPAPVRDRAELLRLLEESIIQGILFCREKEIDLELLLQNNDVFKNLSQFEIYADRLLANEESRKAFFVYENTISSLFEACKPEIIGNPLVRSVAAFQYLRGVIDSILEQKDLDHVGMRIGKLLDESLVVEELSGVKENREQYRITQSGKTWDLSKMNFEKLKEEFKQATFKNIEIADLRAFIQNKLDDMLKQNVTRVDFAQRLQEIIDAYNSGSSSADNYFDELVKFTQNLKEESERHIREGLTEDELEIFDLLKKDKMTKEETQRVKLAAKSLLHRLLEEPPPVLIQDWYKDTQSKKVVQSTVEEVLHSHLPESYDRVLFTEKCHNVFDLMLSYASQGLKWAS